MVEIVWTSPALEDLFQIYLFIARDSKRYAGITVLKLRSAVERLGKFPLSGRELPEFPESGYREILVGHFRIIYRFTEIQNQVVVLAVVHESRLLPPTFFTSAN